jgi:hypothetical protein
MAETERQKYWINTTPNHLGIQLDVYNIRIESGWLLFDKHESNNPHAPIITVAIPPSHPVRVSYGRMSND